MKILYVKSHMHSKNHHSLMNYKNITFYIINTSKLSIMIIMVYIIDG